MSFMSEKKRTHGAAQSCALLLAFGLVMGGCHDSKTGKNKFTAPAEGVFNNATVVQNNETGGGITVQITQGGANNPVEVGIRLVAGGSSNPLLFKQTGTTDGSGAYTTPFKLTPSQIREPQNTNLYEVVAIVTNSQDTSQTQEYILNGVTSGSNVSVPQGHAGDRVRGLINTAIQLQGESYVPNGDAVTHAWTVVTANAPGTISFSDATALTPTITGTASCDITVRRTDTNTVTNDTATFETSVSIRNFIMNASATDDGTAVNLTTPQAQSGTFSIFSSGGITGSLTLSQLIAGQTFPVNNLMGVQSEDVLSAVGGTSGTDVATREYVLRDANPYPISVVTQPGSNAGQLQVTIVSLNGATAADLAIQLEGTTGFVDLTEGTPSGNFSSGATFTISGLPEKARGTLRVRLSDGTNTGTDFARVAFNIPDFGQNAFTVVKTGNLEVAIR